MNMPKNPEGMIQKLESATGALSQMPVEMWHLWVIWVLETLAEHAGEDEYIKFLERVGRSLDCRINYETW